MVQNLRQLGIGSGRPAGGGRPTQQLAHVLLGRIHPERVVDHVVKHKYQLELVDALRDAPMERDIQSRRWFADRVRGPFMKAHMSSGPVTSSNMRTHAAASASAWLGLEGGVSLFPWLDV
jgi:hypothetical protein